LGYKTQSKLEVVGVSEQSKAFKVIEINDQILSIDRLKLNNTNDVLQYLEGKRAGQVVAVEINRPGKGLLIKNIALSPRPDGSAFIGINIQEQFDFPFDVDIKLAETGGPSGGLIFAFVLEILQALALLQPMGWLGQSAVLLRRLLALIMMVLIYFLPQ
jgi:PDZ domain-containing protein